ncbi:3-hydroxyacyl-ACP dehydratase FabZ [Brucepastera parasyntrophica]|uniref:3-hydroxyacyl-ACP dehydratase FabZ n=1 Tax=Brucepastera parasyntrophica TaxID=2880008 RepID=UPI00210CB8E0|nr:3-hydroxyacyl-ACP dehydratase FabZ [Brucepastera parasyntrophica]ULQ60792.1 3-hydroxyacyl-ACP dehydratase FabZ [Brucepastera parasyntrophica]
MNPADLNDKMVRAEERKKIEQLLPHRDPFLFVDVIDVTDEKQVVARHVFSEDEFFFKGHFPEYPVVPGVILVETMAQAGGAGLVRRGIMSDDSLFFLASVDKVKFRKQVRPGDEVRLVIENLRVSPKMIKQAGKAFVGEDLAAEAEWLCLVGGKGDIA